MTKEEYRNAVVAIRAKASEEMRQLAYKYVAENRVYKNGEIISDGHTTIKITGVNIHIPALTYNDAPMYSYKGIQLTKKLEPRKDGAIGYVFPERIK